MMSGQLIAAIQSQAAARAARENKQPLIVWPDAVEHDIRRIPFLGTLVPEGWRGAENGEFPSLPGNSWHHDHPYLFVDKTGFGDPGEPSLTLSQFADAVRNIVTEAAAKDAVVGFALYEEGQFQVYVRCYVKEEGAPGNADEEIPKECPDCGQDTKDADFDGDPVGSGEYGTCSFCGQDVKECGECGDRDVPLRTRDNGTVTCVRCESH